MAAFFRKKATAEIALDRDLTLHAVTIPALQNSVGYTPIMEGDLYVDIALRDIEDRRDLAEASDMLEKAYSLYHLDRNRMARILAIQARIAFVQNRFEDAAALQQEAALRWSFSPNGGNYAWRHDNRFHEFRTRVALRRPRSDAYHKIMQTEDEVILRLRLRLLNHFGTAWLMLDRLLIEP